MKKTLPALAILAMSLSACNSTPASVLEKQAIVDDAIAKHEQQLSAWEEEQAVVEDDLYSAPEPILSAVIDATNRSLIDQDRFDLENVQTLFGLGDYLDAATESGIMGNSLEDWSDHAAGTYSVVFACLGTGSIKLNTFANEQQVSQSTVECGIPLATFETSFALKQSAESIRINIEPGQTVRGRYEFYVYR
ncbi:hypothetical protein [Glutamicibacter arilaitensis]|uniref:hypothetical protein n=1 Tax=Glutamicibacter arilaitensis TaxID=256701 RepID=UPI003850887C